ncbi:signal transduction histidine kinase [Catalinimonas alkaloidigena]|uniref:hypothetical protein n=1 Tax=Catalinimonas alkaloidigena TaxID=1075417 RepID=UPI002404CF3C|nr:hypothetical protein [Catalinimonas alkaloidigena]MDF9797714.1 signal transduction histidine kinase [Catalinimonas alkaloidigena]
MEIDEIKQLWKAYDEKLEQQWQLNLSLLRKANLDKVKNRLTSLQWLNTMVLAVGISLCIVFGTFVKNHIYEIHFVAAGSILFFWSALIAYSAVMQLRMIIALDYTSSIISLQKKLGSLRLVILKYFKLSLLILPFYTAHTIFWFEVLFDIDIYQYGDQRWWISQFVISVVVFVPLTIWLFKKLSPSNINNSWVKKGIEGAGIKQINEALALMEEVEQFEKKEYAL